MLSLKIGSANLKKFLRPMKSEVDTLENQLYEVDNVEREFDRELYMFTKELNGKYRETAQSQFQEIQESKAMESEAYLDSESEPMESEVTILNRARNEFMSGLTNDTSEIKDIYPEFYSSNHPCHPGC